MSEEQLKAFLKKAIADPSLQKKLMAADNHNAVVSIANELGFPISVDTLKKSAGLTPKELESVSGGAAKMAGQAQCVAPNCTTTTGVCGATQYGNMGPNMV